MISHSNLPDALDLISTALGRPAQRFTAERRYLVDHRRLEPPGERNRQAPEQYVVEMFDALVPTDEIDLADAISVERTVLERTVLERTIL